MRRIGSDRRSTSSMPQCFLIPIKHPNRSYDDGLFSARGRIQLRLAALGGYYLATTPPRGGVDFRTGIEDIGTVRYLFRGLIRETGRPVEGHVEAVNPDEALKALSDNAIVTESLVPDPKPLNLNP